MKKLADLFRLLSRGKQIALAVGLAHGLTLATLICHHFIASRLRPPRPMVVKTIVPAVKTEPTIKPKQSATASSPKPKPPATKTSAPVTKAVKQIAGALDAISKEPPKTARPALQIPTRVTQKPEVVERETAEEPSYQEFLIAHLQNILDLPEYGAVRMEIEIDPFGKLVHCQILESKSDKNGKYLTEELALLNFPVPQLDSKERSKKFSITFKNR